MKRTKLQTTLKRLAAAVMAVAVTAGSVTVQRADELQIPEAGQETETVNSEIGTMSVQRADIPSAVVVSIYPGNLESRSKDPAADVHIYGSALCTSAEIPGFHLCQWSAKMWGSMSDAYVAYYSFGYGGQHENKMAKTRFYGDKKSYSTSATKTANSSANAMTALWY